MSKQVLFRTDFVVLALSILTMLALAACSPSGPTGGPPGGPGAAPKIAAVATPTAAPTAAPTATLVVSKTVRAVGNLTAPSQTSLAFQASGLLKEVKVKDGDRVKKGDVLAKLDTTQLDLQVIQAQTAVNLQKINLARVKAGPTKEEIAIAKSNLDKAKASVSQAQAAYDRAGGASNPMIGLMPQSLTLQEATSNYQAALAQYNQAVQHPTEYELNTAQIQYEQAEAALAIAKQNVTYATLVAPFDGTILLVKPKAGELVSQGVAVMMLADLTHMQAESNLDENTLAQVRVGQSVILTLDTLPNKTLTGRVSKIALSGSSVNGVVSVPVTVDIDPTDASIYPGLSATLEFKISQ